MSKFVRTLFFSALVLAALFALPGTLAAQTTVDGPLTVDGGFPEILIGSGMELQSTADALVWTRRSFHFLLDSDNNQPSALFKIYENTSSSSGIGGSQAVPGVQFSIGSGTSWLGLNGNVGIGTTTPQSELAVNGTVTAQEVVVTQDGWPDFVFEEGYPLMPLDELEAAIQDQGHLPGIPSASEVAEQGVSLGDVQAKLLQKVEELTLYMIELKKENDELKTRVATIEGTK